jgi:hypothetical protein
LYSGIFINTIIQKEKVFFFIAQKISISFPQKVTLPHIRVCNIMARWPVVTLKKNQQHFFILQKSIITPINSEQVVFQRLECSARRTHGSNPQK